MGQDHHTKWLRPAMLIGIAGLIALGVSVGMLGGSALEHGSSRSGVESRGFSGHPSAAQIGSSEQSTTSVRDIVDPAAIGYAAPTDPRWGVVGAFPGDTTILIEEGQYLVAARLLGTPGDPLLMQWGDSSYEVIAVYGGGLGWKQRYVTVHENRHYMLPIQWNEQSRTWESYGMEKWFAAGEPTAPRPEDSFEGRCSECHGDERFTTAEVMFGAR